VEVGVVRCLGSHAPLQSPEVQPTTDFGLDLHDFSGVAKVHPGSFLLFHSPPGFLPYLCGKSPVGWTWGLWDGDKDRFHSFSAYKGETTFPRCRLLGSYRLIRPTRILGRSVASDIGKHLATYRYQFGARCGLGLTLRDHDCLTVEQRSGEARRQRGGLPSANDRQRGSLEDGE